jgi:hypothetical protein
MVLVGNEAIVGGFRNYIRSRFPAIVTVLGRQQKLWFVSIEGKHCVLVCKHLYNEHCVSLDRKHEIARRIVKTAHPRFGYLVDITARIL